ncbi:MAG: FIVAR domain-containing protein, partial [Limosilactobacillus sp.]|nr:FIVAR domain-containing protein [Limosilactobacillus sp.]
MVSKNNKKLIAEKNRRNEKQRFAIRKLNIGVASVLLGITFSIYGGGQAVAHADTANASDQVAASDTGDNSLADKSEVALSNTALNASQSSANSQPAATASDNAVASSAAVEATKDQSTAENQPSASQEVQTPAQAQPVVQENGSGDTSLDATRQVLNAVARRNSNSAGAIHLTSFAAVPASTPAVATSDATAEDTNAVTVTDAQGLIDAIQKGSATTINVANDINLAKVTDSNYTYIRKINTRDFTIKSATNGVKHTIDFSGYVFNMSTPNTVTFKDLDIYARSYWGVVYNAGGYVYDNVNFTGSQLIYTASNTDATVTFKNKVTATTVGSYTSPIDGKSRSSQGGDTQQILQFEGGTNQIIFDENSDVTLGTTNSNVLEVDRGTATIDVKNGANVTINPHSKGNPENRNGIGTGSIARAIASNANTTINVDKGANLTINTEKASGDSDVAGALYLNSDATLNVNGDLNINSTGTPSTKNDGYPVYIAGNAAINVGNGGKFNLSATNTGSYNDNLMSISGKGTVKLAPHSNFKISGDGTGALTAINLSSGSTFTSDQPDLFTIDLSANTSTGKSLIKNGTIHFTRVKTVTDGNESQPLGKIDVTYDRNGNATSYTITAQDENTVKQVGEGLANKNLIDLVKAGEDVTLSNLHLSKNNVLTGTVASSGSDNPIYVTVKVGKGSANVPVIGNYTVYTNTNGTVTSNNVDYAAQTASTGGNFSIDLSKLASSLTDDAQVTVTATKDFVEAAQTESVAALRALNTTTLQELVDDAPTEEAKPSYYNATAEAQKAYIDAISTGKDILANPNNYDQVDVDDAVNAIQTAQKALTGKETNKTELQDAIDQASTVESSNNYTNADSNLQKAYTDAISAGQTVLSNDNATQTEVDNALTTINNAKDALNGDAKKAASKEALQQAVAEAPTVKADDAAYYNGSDEAKAAYDKAISAGQAVLDNSNATATQITDALNTINTAKGNLKGEATDKLALQTAVDNSATVKESNNYTNADETQKTAYDNAVTAAQTVLDKTNATQAEVNQALQDLKTANNNLNGDAKTEAANKAALEAAVKDAPNVRNTPAYYNGSKEAQTAYNNAINAGQAVLNETNPFASDVKNALDAINAAKDNLKGETTSTEALETALTNANTAKLTGNYTNADQANQEVLNNAITAGQDLLKNTKATQAQVDSAAKAITNAINGLNGNTNLANAKTTATEDIKKALDTKTTEITEATNIDQATKDKLIADAKKAAEDANTAINQATNADAVNTAKTEGITNINNVKIPSLDGAKQAAKQAIDQALDTKTKEINAANNIDQTTKDQLIKEATDAATTAKDAIEKATTNDAATKAGQDGVDAINNVKVPSVTDSQNAAKEAIDDTLNAKTKEINDATNIDQTTKDQLIKEATDAANNAKEAIDKATTADAIKTAQNEGTTNINKVTVLSLEDAKKAATKAVDDALTAQTEVINKADNLSDAEKKDLIDQATTEANKAKDNIETATTNNEAAQAGQAGVDAIKKIVPTSLDTVKSDANKAIDDALTKKLEEINSANALTTNEKNALTQEANTAADKAKKEITKATTNDAVIEAQNNGVTAIDGIKVPTESAVKEAAK